MSLRQFVERPDVRSRLADIMPPRPWTLTTDHPPLSCTSASPSTFGIAFDYAVRIEIQCRCPHANAGPWAAELAADRVAALAGDHGPRAAHVVRSARTFIAKQQGPTNGESRCELARHAFRLAKLDPFARVPGLDARYLDELESVTDAQIGELAALLASVPFERLCHPSRLALNPVFGRYSILVGGADADIIAGDLLIELKVTAKSTIEPPAVRQLLGYLILARRACNRLKWLPKPRRIGIYSARFGELWSPNVRINELPRYRETADWFIARVREEGGSVIASRLAALRGSARQEP